MWDIRGHCRRLYNETVRVTQYQIGTLERILLAARLDEGHRDDVDIEQDNHYLILRVPWQREVIRIDEDGMVKGGDAK